MYFNVFIVVVMARSVQRLVNVLDHPVFECRQGQASFLLQNAHTSSGAYPVSYMMDNGVLPRGA
jgi:hypothetical protein